MKKLVILTILALSISCGINVSCRAHSKPTSDTEAIVVEAKSNIPTVEYLSANCPPADAPAIARAFGKHYMIVQLNNCFENERMLLVVWGPELNDDEVVLATAVATYFRTQELELEEEFKSEYLGVLTKIQDPPIEGQTNTVHMAFFKLTPKHKIQ